MKTTDRATLAANVLTLLHAIAPELEPQGLVYDKPLRSQVDLDSIDWLNFLVSLSEHFGVQIAAADAAGLVSLNDVLDYLAGKTG